MLAQINSCGLLGIDGFPVRVEADISSGLPAFNIVGLPDAAVREAKERVCAAVKNSFARYDIMYNICVANPRSPEMTGIAFLFSRTYWF